MVESIAGKYSVGFRRESTDWIVSKVSLMFILSGIFTDNYIAAIVCSILLKT